MADPVFSPDGKWMWTGTDWIPSPPVDGATPVAPSPDTSGQTVNLQDSVVGRDVVHSTVIHNDVEAVTSAVITALKEFGIGPTVETPPAPPVIESHANVPFHVDERVLANWKGQDHFFFGVIRSVNSDGTFDIAYDDGDLEANVAEDRVLHAPSLVVGDRVFVNWKGLGTYFPAHVSSVHPNHTYAIQYDDGDQEDGVTADKICLRAEQPDEVTQYVEAISEAEQELVEAFQVFDDQGTGLIAASSLFEILTTLGDPLSDEEASEFFTDLNIDLESMIDYRQLAKALVS